ncbi:MAG: VOC family protein [Pseudomonadota bacterium]
MARGFKVRALGEIAIRCADLEAMMQFYGEVLGLELLSGGHRDGIVFYRMGESYGGHTAVLALFRHDAQQRDVHPTSAGRPVTGAAGSLHHLALTVDAAEQDAIIAWYEAEGRSYRIEDFPWIGWRGIFTEDPEGNTVELVAKVADPQA